MTLDELRERIERRLAELADEDRRLQAALAVLNGSATPTTRTRSPKAPRPSRATNGQAPKPTRRKPKEPKSTTAAVAKRGATRRAVLDALADGSARTAGDIATATGIGRGSVSTTLSNLLAAGQVLKADRGYIRTNPTPGPPAPISDPEQSAGQPTATTDRGLAAIRSELAAGLRR